MVQIIVRTPKQIKRYNKRKFYESLLGGVCVNCGSDKQLEFDHVFPEDMLFRIGNHIDCSIEKVLPELQKCQLLCRSCHINKTIADSGDNLLAHGTAAMYTNHGCRCEQCRAVWSKYTRKNASKYYYKNIEQERSKRREYGSKYRFNRKNMSIVYN